MQRFHYDGEIRKLAQNTYRFNRRLFYQPLLAVLQVDSFGGRCAESLTSQIINKERGVGSGRLSGIDTVDTGLDILARTAIHILSHEQDDAR